jgi:hypothetical protein
MKTKIFFFILFSLFSVSCKTYLASDSSSKYRSNQKKECFLNQKIELLGFTILLDSNKYERNLSPVYISNLESKITDKEHLKIIRFVNSAGRMILPENKNSFTSLTETSSRSTGMRINDKYLENDLSSKKYFPETNKNYTNKSLNPDQKRFREFLATFLLEYKHLGLEEISLLIEQKDEQIRLKNPDRDYYIIGIHEHKSDPNGLTALFSIFTFGILPTYSEEIIKSRFYLYDTSLREIRYYDYETSSSALTGLLLIGDTTISKEYYKEYLEIEFKNIMNQFTKELALDICK